MADYHRARPLAVEAGYVLVHWSLIAFVPLAAGLVLLAHASPPGRDLATPVFAIAGTLVALIVPAASLSGAYVDPGLTFWGEQLAIADEGDERVAAGGRLRIEKMVSAVTPLWRGFVYILVAFVASAVALFRPGVAIEGYTAEEILIGASLALIIVAVLSFLPFTWEVLRLRVARDALDGMFPKDVDASRRAQAGSGPAAAGANAPPTAAANPTAPATEPKTKPRSRPPEA